MHRKQERKISAPGEQEEAGGYCFLHLRFVLGTCWCSMFVVRVFPLRAVILGKPEYTMLWSPHAFFATLRVRQNLPFHDESRPCERPVVFTRSQLRIIHTRSPSTETSWGRSEEVVWKLSALTSVGFKPPYPTGERLHDTAPCLLPVRVFLNPFKIRYVGSQSAAIWPVVNHSPPPQHF